MEIILAIAVISAVIFFGALISIGNDRQRKAIDGLRHQVTMWAIQDLRIKGEKFAREVTVKDPLEWLSRVVSKASGKQYDLDVVGTVDNHLALVCLDRNGNHKLAVSLQSPLESRKAGAKQRNRLSGGDLQDDFLSLVKRADVYELSLLNGGTLFDLELQVVWEQLTRQRHDGRDVLWVYVALE